jgi:hypothetical protein
MSASITITAEDFVGLHNKALQAAKDAASAYFSNELRGWDDIPCGFACTKVYGVKLSSKLGKAMQRAGFTACYTGGIELHNPSGHICQNVYVKFEGAVAYANVLKAAGFDTNAIERWD